MLKDIPAPRGKFKSRLSGGVKGNSRGVVSWNFIRFFQKSPNNKGKKLLDKQAAA
ncbi:MAG: hypothetical protein SPI81_00185 [Candidatus Faecousia sp.]|nr:hypothetical protein [Candidatus Faecousia sp.]